MSKKDEKKAPETENEKVQTEETKEAAQNVKSKEEELTEKLAEQNEKYARLFAEYDNFRKRSAREKDARYGEAIIDAVAALLPIGDNLARALETEVESEDAKKFKAGIDMVMKQFNESLDKLEVKPINAKGEQFDPKYHNAVMHIDDETIDDNTVVEEFMKGYIYKGDRVVRHSMVKVAN